MSSPVMAVTRMGGRWVVQCDACLVRCRGVSHQRESLATLLSRSSVWGCGSGMIAFAMDSAAREGEPPTELGEKRCASCGRVLPLDAFGLDARAKDGRSKRCMECGGARGWED